jgi:hypothetical protein
MLKASIFSLYRIKRLKVGIASYSVAVDPPAAVILSIADDENACAVTVTLTEISPLPRTFTGRLSRTAPAAMRDATVTSPPFG